ncbi:helix-turn-helix transcriptional regulator [Mastigocoleus testarum]|uniref:helix-turn-helix transcriptional regulator n=1 Tax=Mastigocoleus testarum TaxID=996925 RepID=UPI00041A2428|nr:AraC family transcriptional regulator [Mastigocoleus testarum]
MSDKEHPVHLHLLESFNAGWSGLQLIHEIEPADEIPQTYLGQHFIAIALGDFRASYMLGGTWHHVDYTKGDIAIIPANQPFPRTQVDRKVELLELFLSPIAFERINCELLDIDRIELVPQWYLRDPLIEHMGLALKTELELGGADSRFYADSMTNALSVHLLSRYSTRTQEIKSYTGGLPKAQLRKIIDYIEENLDQNLTLTSLSKLIHITPNYFASLFKESTGITVHQYVMGCRIEKAKKLLRRRDLNLKIIEICQQVGFQNQSHFTRVFRQYTATTPKVYRNNFH